MDVSDVTLYIPCYRAERTLVSVLEGVAGLRCLPARVLVVDDGSPGPCTEACLEDGRGGGVAVEVIRHADNRGLAAARNTALGACRTRLLAALDADVVPAPDWLDVLLATQRQTGAVGVGGRLDEAYDREPGDAWRAHHMAQHFGDERRGHPRFLFGANTLFVADALRDAGGYDEAFRTNNEDRSMSEALYRRGGNLVYEPAARCLHLRRDTVPSVLRGFWQWFHAEGVRQGAFDAWASVMDRIERVNFGIYDYRYGRDEQMGRADFLAIDQLLPWVFCTLDLLLFRRRTGARIPFLPDGVPLAASTRDAIRSVLPGEESADEAVQVDEGLTDEAARYLEVFGLALERFGWHERASAVPVWREDASG